MPRTRRSASPTFASVQANVQAWANAARIAATVAVLLCAASAHAQTAQQLLDQGRQALNAGRYGEAAKALDASYRKEQKPVTLYNLGLAYKGMGYPDKALQAFESYVQFANPKTDKATIAAVRTEMKRIKSGYGRFAPKLTPADAIVEVDGKAVQASSGELWIPVGSHRISIRADGYETYEQALQVAPGRFDLEIALREPSMPPPQRAAALLDEGVALQAASKFPDAIAKFEQAQKIYPTPRGAGQLGLAQESAGELAAAEANLEQALKQRKDPWVRENRRQLRRARARVRRQLGSLKVQGEPSGAEVLVNGESVGALPLPEAVRVAAGSVTVRAVKEGFVDFEQTLTLPARGVRTVRVSMREAPTPVAAPVPTPTPAAAPPVAEKPPPEPVKEPPPPAPIDTDVPLQEPERVADSDYEALADPAKDLEGDPDAKEKPATGFELNINFGYQPWIGGPKLAGSSGAMTAQVMLGARLLWPLSFGVQLIQGGFDTGNDRTKVAANINPGFYVRGHIQREKKPLNFDVWAGTGLQPLAVQIAALKAEPIDPNAINPAAVSGTSQDVAEAIAQQQSGVERIVTIQSINVPLELGATFYITPTVGLDLAMALTFWLPQQQCLHNIDFKERACEDSGLKSQTSLFIGAGLALLP